VTFTLNDKNELRSTTRQERPTVINLTTTLISSAALAADD
jgi:hypothetical protein